MDSFSVFYYSDGAKLHRSFVVKSHAIAFAVSCEGTVSVHLSYASGLRCVWRRDPVTVKQAAVN